METLNVKRITALAQLANLKGLSLDNTMEELGLLKNENI
jgi:hypothetical protein